MVIKIRFVYIFGKQMPLLNKYINVFEVHRYKISSSEKSFDLKNQKPHLFKEIAESETPEIFMYCLFSDTPRFSDSFLTDQMCH